MLVYLYIPVYAGLLYQLRGRGYGAVIKGMVIQILTAGFVNIHLRPVDPVQLYTDLHGIPHLTDCLRDGRIYKKYYGADPLCEGTGSRGKGAVRSYSGPGGGL